MPVPTNSRTIVNPDGTTVTFNMATRPTNVAQNGNLTVGVTQSEIVIAGTPKEILLKAASTNTNTIWIGKTGVQNDGSAHLLYLDPGDEVTLTYDDTTVALYAISDAAAQSLSVGALL